MKNKTFTFSIAGSLLIIAFLFITNITTSWSHPWFIYPTFAVLWWPLSIFFSSNKKWKLFAVSGSILTAIFFILINRITSPSFPWAIFPIYSILWWPLSMIFARKKYKLYSIITSLYTITFFFIVNMITSPNAIWFIYPTFAVIWWPISMIICGAKRYKLYSIVSSIYTITFFVIVNLITSSQYLWFYYPAYAIIWWPLSMIFAKKKTIKLYSVAMSLLTIGFLALINIINTPNILWFQWTIFYFLWWPVVMFLGKKANTITFSIVSSIIIIAYYVMQYYVQTPRMNPWYLYIVLPVIWWPVSMIFKDKMHTKTFLIINMIIFTVYYGMLNLLLTPDRLWIIYLVFVFAWVGIGNYFGHRNRIFALSIWGSIITIALFVLINYMHSPYHIWAVYPAFAIVWWPLSVYFFKVRKINENKSYRTDINN